MNFINKIVSAANVYEVTNGDIKERIVIPDNCHMGRNMQAITKLFRAVGCEVKCCNDLEDRGQGFIDESGNYYNRGEAYVVAKASGQPFNDEYTLPGDRLDSSCIRHFSADKTLLEYMPVNHDCECGANQYEFYEQRAWGQVYECVECRTPKLKVELVEAGLL